MSGYAARNYSLNQVSPMVKFGCGILMLLFGAVLAIWGVYIVLIARERDWKMAGGAVLFMCGLFFVGGKWALEGWPTIQEMFRPRKRKKKRGRMRADEYE
jgi:hypothetical protein